LQLQRSVARHVRCGRLLSYHITLNLSLSLVVKKSLKSVNTSRSYRQKGWLSHVPCACLKMKNWPDNLPVMGRHCFSLVMLLGRSFLTSVSTNIKLPQTSLDSVTDW